jgi:hypothetical protein
VPHGDTVVQECGAGLVDVRRSPRLGFAAPPLRRSGPVEPDLRARVVRALGVADDAVEAMAWIDNGPGWVGVDLGSAESVVAVEPDIAAFTDLKVTILGRWDPASAAEVGADVEVRAFYADGRDFGEDPVTGSANAGLAQWLIGAGALPSAYTSRQGSVIGREGRVRLQAADGHVWVSGGRGDPDRGRGRPVGRDHPSHRPVQTCVVMPMPDVARCGHTRARRSRGRAAGGGNHEERRQQERARRPARGGGSRRDVLRADRPVLGLPGQAGGGAGCSPRRGAAPAQHRTSEAVGPMMVRDGAAGGGGVVGPGSGERRQPVADRDVAVTEDEGLPVGAGVVEHREGDLRDELA